MKVLHDRAVETCKAVCERLKEAKNRPRDSPVKPKRPLKPKPVVEDELDDDEDDEIGK